jgi:hypothetical protein
MTIAITATKAISQHSNRRGASCETHVWKRHATTKAQLAAALVREQELLREICQCGYQPIITLPLHRGLKQAHSLRFTNIAQWLTLFQTYQTNKPRRKYVAAVMS